MALHADRVAPLRRFVQAMTRLVAESYREADLLPQARGLLATLIGQPDWLPEPCSLAEPGTYRQYLLHVDPLERFSIVSFVWGPQSATPVHDHTVWGLVGMYQGQELCEEFAPGSDGRVRSVGRSHILRPGMIEAVSPSLGDWHRVSNGLADKISISIHVYGGNIGALHRHKLSGTDGAIEPFVSGYSSAMVPNLWDHRGAA